MTADEHRPPDPLAAIDFPDAPWLRPDTDVPRPPDEYEQVGWTCSTGPISQARIFVAQVKPGPPPGSMAWEPVYVRR